MKISSSNLSKILLSSILTMSLGFSLGVNADDSEQIKSSLMSRMTSSDKFFCLNWNRRTSEPKL